MTSFLRASLIASSACLVLAASAGAQTAAPAAPSASQPPTATQRWVDDRAAMLDARLGGLKAGLRLTPDQEKLWGPFETAVRDFVQTRMNRMHGMMEHDENDESGPDNAGPPPSPLDRLDRMATRLSDAGAALKKIAGAGQPLYASLDDQQKRIFGFLSREMMKMGRGSHEMGPPGDHHGGPDEGDGDNKD
jgi:hypothetical protein